MKKGLIKIGENANMENFIAINSKEDGIEILHDNRENPFSDFSPKIMFGPKGATHYQIGESMTTERRTEFLSDGWRYKIIHLYPIQYFRKRK
jgi:hypothetical protein